MIGFIDFLRNIYNRFFGKKDENKKPTESKIVYNIYTETANFYGHDHVGRTETQKDNDFIQIKDGEPEIEDKKIRLNALSNDFELTVRVEVLNSLYSNLQKYLTPELRIGLRLFALERLMPIADDGKIAEYSKLMKFRGVFEKIYSDANLHRILLRIVNKYGIKKPTKEDVLVFSDFVIKLSESKIPNVIINGRKIGFVFIANIYRTKQSYIKKIKKMLENNYTDICVCCRGDGFWNKMAKDIANMVKHITNKDYTLEIIEENVPNKNYKARNYHIMF